MIASASLAVLALAVKSCCVFVVLKTIVYGISPCFWPTVPAAYGSNGTRAVFFSEESRGGKPPLQLRRVRSLVGAGEHGIAVLGLHHTKKRGADDA
jgi:hypothetical protein